MSQEIKADEPFPEVLGETRSFCLERRGNQIFAGQKKYPGIMTVSYPSRASYIPVATIHDLHGAKPKDRFIKMLVSDKEIWKVVMADRIHPNSILRFKRRRS